MYCQIMMRIVCPDCSAVIQEASVPSVSNRANGVNDLIRHVTDNHVIPCFENMLYYSAMVAQQSGVDFLKEATQPLCAGCDKPVRTHTGVFYRVNGRTQHCCSLECYGKAQGRHGEA
jgi:hypothetical protein